MDLWVLEDGSPAPFLLPEDGGVASPVQAVQEWQPAPLALASAEVVPFAPPTLASPVVDAFGLDVDALGAFDVDPFDLFDLLDPFDFVLTPLPGFSDHPGAELPADSTLVGRF